MKTILKKHKTDSQRTVLMNAGTICFRNTRLGCVVLNISPGSAGLVVESDAAIPFAFDLAIESEPFRRPCLLAWRIDRRIGVAFDFNRMPRDDQ